MLIQKHVLGDSVCEGWERAIRSKLLHAFPGRDWIKNTSPCARATLKGIFPFDKTRNCFHDKIHDSYNSHAKIQKILVLFCTFLSNSMNFTIYHLINA